LTGHDQAGLEQQIAKDSDIQVFFDEAPQMHPNNDKSTGVVCGVRVETLDDPLIKKARRMDKLVDELAKAKAMDKIVRK